MKVIQDVVSDLGLPSPEAIVVEDQDMADAYRSFCRLLHYASKPIAVLADGEFFALGDGQDEIPLTSYPRLRLLSALIGRSEVVFREIRGRTR